MGQSSYGSGGAAGTGGGSGGDEGRYPTASESGPGPVERGGGRVGIHAAAPGAGFIDDWMQGVHDADWSGERGKALLQNGTQVRQNGRYLYSFRGGAGANLEIYDLAGNAWINVGTQYGNALETFTTGSCSVDFNGSIYLMKEATGRLFRFDVVKNVLEPWSTNVYPQSTAVEGDKLMIVP